MKLQTRKILGSVMYMGGVPTLPEQFGWSWSQMVQYNAERLCNENEYIHYDRVQSSYHAFARNQMVKKIRGDWLLMLDTDIRFDPDVLERMLNCMKEHNFLVLTALYIHKNYPHTPVLYNYSEERQKNETIAKWNKNVPFQVDSAGAGCLLIKTELFDYIDQQLGEEPFSVVPPYSEDLSFFNRLKRLKVPAYVDPRIEVNHLAWIPLNYEQHSDSNQLQLSKQYTRIPAILDKGK